MSISLENARLSIHSARLATSSTGHARHVTMDICLEEETVSLAVLQQAVKIPIVRTLTKMGSVLTATADITSPPQRLAGHSTLSAKATPKTRHYVLIAMMATDYIRVSVFLLLKCPLRTKTPTVSK